MPATTPLVLVYATSESPTALAARLGVADDRVLTTVHADAARALASSPADADVVLLHARARLAPAALARFIEAAKAAEADVVSPLDDCGGALSPLPEGHELAIDDIAAVDRAAASFGERALLPTTAWSPLLSYWRTRARNEAGDLDRWRDGQLPDTLSGAVATRIFVAAGERLCGPARATDPRFPRATDALEVLRSRFRPLPGRYPAHPGQDGRPVVLHILHGWGGGAERYVRDLAGADDTRCHLVLRARGDAARRCHGECLELALAADPHDTPLRRWPLARAIATTAIAHDEYRAILATICADHAVDVVVVSSLIGHALDALRTQRPTVVFCHDYYPAWPVLHADFGDPQRHYDHAEFTRDLAGAGEPLFPERNPRRWLALREAWVEAVAAAEATLVAPSQSVFANLERILPGRLPARRHVIPHGFVPFASEPERATLPPQRRPRVLVLGRINGGKGEVLLDPLLTELRGEIDLYLLGCGNAGQRYFGRSGVHIELDYARDALPDLVGNIAPDLALMPVTVAETYSYTLSELRALGVPVLATRIGAFVERITDGVDGHLVEPDAARVAGRLRELLADPAARAASAAAARQGLRTMATTLAEHAAVLPTRPRDRSTVDAGAQAVAAQAEACAQALVALRETDLRVELQATARALQQELERRADWGHALDRQCRELGMRIASTAAEVERVAAERDDRTRWAQALDAELAQARAHIGERDAELERRAAWARNLDAEVARLGSLLVDAHASSAQLGQRLADTERQLAATTASLASTESERLRVQTELDTTHAALNATREALAAREAEIAARLRELADREADLAARTRERDELLASTSWRITAPLRALVLFARRVRTSLRFRAGRALGLVTRTRMSLRTRGPAGTLRRIREYIDPPPPPASVAALPKPQDQPDFQPFTVATTATPVVSVVIPVYNHFAHTRTCLQSLAANPGSVGFEVIVVDDCSADATPELLPRIGGIRVLRNAQNLGFIGACNAGLAAARGDYVVFLNNDTAVQPGWLEALVSTFASRPDCGLAGAKLVYPDGRLQEAGGIVFKDGSGWNYGRFGDPADAACNYVREVDYCSGAAIMLRRDLLAELGGFDPLYAPAYYEDTDLAFRVRARGLKVYYQPAAVVVHFEGVSSGTDTASGVKRYQVVNQQKFLDRWREVLASHPAPGMPIPIAREHRARGRVLIIDACTPTPDQDSGSVRMVNTMRALVDLGWKVAFVAENRAWDPKYTPPLQQLGVEMLYHPWFADAPKWLAEHGDELDCVVLSRHYVAAPLIDVLKAYAPRARRIFDTVDLHFLREERYAALSGSTEAATQARATRAQELAVMRACELTWVVSETERSLLAEVAPDVRVDLLSNVHEVVGNRRGFDARRDLWFVGGFQHTPNVDAMQWFCGEIWPAVAARLPDARFHIVGSKMPAEVKALESERIVVHGHVESLDGFLDDCRLSVAPLRYGAGVKGKINSAMAHGQPVVATPIAVEGMHLVDGDSVLVADTAAAFADAVVRLYEDRVLWERLSAAGVANVQTHFSFDAARDALVRALPEPRRW